MIARRDDGSWEWIVFGDSSWFFEVRVICYLFIIEFRLIPETENESWEKLGKNLLF